MVDNTELLQKAADRIRDCDFFLVAAGAGLSADSGLPTYADVARSHPAYEAKGIEYGDMCRISCLLNDPKLFYGFWGTCFAAYRDATPHDGYRILREWCERPNLASYHIYTSNVDGYFRRAGFSEERIHEIHGRIDVWIALDCDQKADHISPSSPRVQLPSDYEFDIDPATQELRTDHIMNQPLHDAFRKSDHVIEDQRLLRPAVLMFDDGIDTHNGIGLHKSSQRYQEWESQMETDMETNSQLKLVVLELGCGTRVPSVRRECEDVIADTAERCGGSNNLRCTHIRVNPEEYQVQPDIDGSAETVGIAMSALECLLKLDEIVTNIKT